MLVLLRGLRHRRCLGLPQVCHVYCRQVWIALRPCALSAGPCYFPRAFKYFVHIYDTCAALCTANVLPVVDHMSFHHLTCIADECGVLCRLARCMCAGPCYCACGYFVPGTYFYVCAALRFAHYARGCASSFPEPQRNIPGLILAIYCHETPSTCVSSVLPTSARNVLN